MSHTSNPQMESYSRHAIVCTGRFCSPEGRGRGLYARLAQLLDREDLLFGPNRVKRSEAPCLGVCAGGPIMVVYPEGTWYCGMNSEVLEQVVCEHLRDGQPLARHVFHQLEANRPNDSLTEEISPAE